MLLDILPAINRQCARLLLIVIRRSISREPALAGRCQAVYVDAGEPCAAETEACRCRRSQMLKIIAHGARRDKPHHALQLSRGYLPP